MLTDIGVIEQSLFSLEKKHPYYLFCPPIKIHSAGVSAMHRLCHLLNRMGFPAYVVIEREFLGRLGYPKYPTYPGLVTPELSEALARQHFDEGLTPIVIYPDSVKGDPLNAPYICRYMLNYPGFFGGETSFLPDETVFSYSKKIALRTKAPENVLFLPISDPSFFVPSQEERKRAGAYRYNQKFVYIHGGTIDPELQVLPEITRDRADSPSKKELREIFQSREYFYAFENTALSIEAALCGCPVILMPNEWFTEVIAEYELGMDGFAWGNTPPQIEKARETIHLFRDRYLNCIKNVGPSIERFVHVTQDRVRSAKYEMEINFSVLPIHVGVEIGHLITPVRLSKRLADLTSGRSFKDLVILTTKNCVLRSLRFLGLEKPVVPIIKRLVGLARGRTFTQFLFLFTKKIIIRGLRVIKMEKPIKKAVDNSKYWFHRHDKMGKLWMQRLGFRKFVPGENQLPMGELPPHVL